MSAAASAIAPEAAPEAHVGDGDGAEGRQRRCAGIDRGDQCIQLVAGAQAHSHVKS